MFMGKSWLQCSLFFKNENYKTLKIKNARYLKTNIAGIRKLSLNVENRNELNDKYLLRHIRINSHRKKSPLSSVYVFPHILQNLFEEVFCFLHLFLPFRVSSRIRFNLNEEHQLVLRKNKNKIKFLVYVVCRSVRSKPEKHLSLESME